MNQKKSENQAFKPMLSFARQDSGQVWNQEFQKRRNKHQQNPLHNDQAEENFPDIFFADNTNPIANFSENPYRQMIEGLNPKPFLKQNLGLQKLDSNFITEPILAKRESASFGPVRKHSDSIALDNKSEKGFVPLDSHDNLSLNNDHTLLSLKKFESRYSHISVNLQKEVSICNPVEIKQMEEKYIPHNSEYPNFGRLYELLKKLFTSDRIRQNDTELKDYEFNILTSIVNRKYKHKINFESVGIKLCDKLNDPDVLISKKRPEENYKFIFKRCIKFMRDRLKAFSMKKQTKKEFDEFFYRHYFEDVAKKEGMDLDNFKNPKRTKEHSNCPKTINMKYIRSIKKSQLFLTDFNNYIGTHLEKDYEITILEKLKKMVMKWEENFKTNKNRDEEIKKILLYIKENKKCKLPWSLAEIQRAIKSLKKMFDECENFE